MLLIHCLIDIPFVCEGSVLSLFFMIYSVSIQVLQSSLRGRELVALL